MPMSLVFDACIEKQKVSSFPSFGDTNFWGEQMFVILSELDKKRIMWHKDRHT